jgi:hypothetical protein
MTFTDFLRAIGILPHEDKTVKKHLTPEQFLLVKEEYKKFQAIIEKEYNDRYEFHRKYENSTNNECPKCKSKNVNDRIQRLQGEFSGNVSGHSSLLGGGWLSGSSSGKLDTNEINKCMYL